MLMTTGDVVVPAFDQGNAVFDKRCSSLIIQRDADVRADFALALPPLNIAAAEWATVLLFQACQLLVCREVPETIVTTVLSKPCGEARNPSTDYSVDLIFQFLPDLYSTANRLGPGDPLVAALYRLAREWPLSSVGIPLSDPPAEITFASDPDLLRIYADRVTERGAKDRLNNPALRQILRTDAGLLPDILPFPASTYSHD
jgi:hypothetical protein